MRLYGKNFIGQNILSLAIWLSCVLWFSIALALPRTAHAADSARRPESARTLLPDDVQRSVGGLTGERHCFRLELPESGLLHLALGVPGEALAGARFTLLGRGPHSTLERSPSEYLARTGPGVFWVEVQAEDPRQALPPYRLSSAFVPAPGLALSETDGELDLDPEAFRMGCELELDPEALRRSLPGPGQQPIGDVLHGEFLRGALGDILKSETDGELDLDPEAVRVACAGQALSETDGELDLDPEALRVICEARDARLLAQRLCAKSTLDDHADSLLCASPWDSDAHGELDNDWTDDADVFRFEVDRWQTVEITTRSAIETHGTLYDALGQRLEQAEASGPDGDFRIIRTLGPGTYFVRVEGLDAAGSYQLLIGPP